MGANNLGAAVMSSTLQDTWQRNPRAIPIGINLCKSKITPLEEAAADYLGSFRYLKDVADYFVVNVSSPNTPGLRSLQSGEQLEPILAGLQAENSNNQPIFVKISPDLDWESIDNIINLARTYNLAGIIATNTTIKRDGLKTNILEATGKPIEEEAGGISGAPLKERSTEVIRFIWQQTQGKLPIIGIGGIFSAEDAWEKITAGASLLQVYTGWVYRGPWLVPQILQGLLQKLEATGLTNISEAIGLQF
jgi:dihydroorotate dehydrogenase